MKSLAELQAIRDKARANLNVREENADSIRVVVGMATCGIAAGARDVLNALTSEISKLKVENVTVAQTGCIGMCQFEPIVEILEPGKEKFTYGKVDKKVAERIVAEHLAEGKPVAEFAISNLMK